MYRLSREMMPPTKLKDRQPMRISLEKRWRERLQAWPESGMGFQRVDVTTTDGRRVRGLLVYNGELLDVPDELGELAVADLRLSRD
jgi:hypothetical protein